MCDLLVAEEAMLPFQYIEEEPKEPTAYASAHGGYCPRGEDKNKDLLRDNIVLKQREFLPEMVKEKLDRYAKGLSPQDRMPSVKTIKQPYSLVIRKNRPQAEKQLASSEFSAGPSRPKAPSQPPVRAPPVEVKKPTVKAAEQPESLGQARRPNLGYQSSLEDELFGYDEDTEGHDENMACPDETMLDEDDDDVIVTKEYVNGEEKMQTD
jgi:hypothetical protein